MEALIRFWDTLSHQLLAFLPRLLWALLVIVAGALIKKLLVRPRRRFWKKIPEDQIMEKYIGKLIGMAIWFFTLIIAADILGIPVSSVLTVLAALGAAIALAIKDNLSNLASGVVLLFTRPFKAGDFVEVEGVSGTVKEIRLMQTCLDTTTNTVVAVPNSTMVSAVIVNYSVYDTRRQDLVFSVAYESDLLKAKELLQKLADEHPLVLKDPAPIVRVKEHGDSAVFLLMRVWSKSGDYWDLQFDMLEKVKLLFDENAITIPFPQITVHHGDGERRA